MKRGKTGTGRTDIAQAVVRRLDELAEITSEPGKITRLYLTRAHKDAIAVVSTWMRDAGMSVRLDATGTVVGRYESDTPGARTLLLGSHIDTVRDAGRFDGCLGVLAAIALVDRLAQSATRLPFAIEVLAFGDEEGVRFSSTLGGSRAIAGRFDPSILDETDASGITRGRALIDFGLDPAAISGEARDAREVLGYLEMHIEQGPVLEAEHLPVAVVTAIAGSSRGTVTVRGTSGHAGTVPMRLRRDALAGAAEMIEAVERVAAEASEIVATVGRIDVGNAAGNTIPGRVDFSLDVRSPDDHARRALLRAIGAEFKRIARRRHLELAVDFGFDAPAAAADAVLSHHLGAAIAAEGIRVHRMPSGAGHDAMALNGCIPFAMLFVRCKGGVSHNPAEFASAADIGCALRVLERAILGMAADKPFHAASAAS